MAVSAAKMKNAIIPDTSRITNPIDSNLILFIHFTVSLYAKFYFNRFILLWVHYRLIGI
jgi:hypothetical protein